MLHYFSSEWIISVPNRYIFSPHFVLTYNIINTDNLTVLDKSADSSLITFDSPLTTKDPVVVLCLAFFSVLYCKNTVFLKRSKVSLIYHNCFE